MRLQQKIASSGRTGEQGNTRLILLVVLCFGLGVGASAYWFSRKAHSAGTESGDQAASALSDSTLATLKRVGTPVELRLYSSLDPATTPESLKAFAARVDKFLTDYQQASGGKVKVIRVQPNSYAAANAAVADGIRPFNADKGDACFLGIAVVAGDRKESLAQLSPDWEQPLEADLTRAGARVQDANNAAVQVPPSPMQIAATQQVQTLLPNLAGVSLEDGSRMLREAALKEFQAAAQDMQAKIQDAQQQLLAAQNSNSDSEQQAAMKRLQQLQSDQAQKLQEIAAKAKAQIDALQQLKAAAK